MVEADPMMLVGVGGIVVLLVLGTAGVVFAANQPRSEGPHELALSLLAGEHEGLIYTPPEGFVDASVRGTWRGASLEIGSATEGRMVRRGMSAQLQQQTVTRFVVRHPDTLSAACAPDDPTGPMARPKGLRVGDPSLDGIDIPPGASPLDQLARLGADARRALRDATRSGWRLDRGLGGWVLSVGDPLPHPAAAKKLLASLEPVLSATASPPEGRTAALTHHLHHDPEPRFRAQVLRHWLEVEVPPRPLLQALSEGDDEVALLAAGALGGDGEGVLRRLASASTPHLQLGAACALAEAGHGGEEVDAALAAAMVRQDRMGDVLKAAGAVGSVALVPALRRTADHHPHAPVRQRADDAIRAIQERSAGSAGQLAIAEGVGGTLAIAEGAGGARHLGEAGRAGTEPAG